MSKIQKSFCLLFLCLCFSMVQITVHAENVDDTLTVKEISPIYSSTVVSDDNNGSSSFFLTLFWSLENNKYNAGDYFTVQLPEPARFPATLIGQTINMVDEDQQRAGLVTITSATELKAQLGEYVETKQNIRGTIKVSFLEENIKFGEEHVFAIKVNNQDPKFTPGSIRGKRGNGAYFTLVKGPLSFNDKDNKISWYAMLNVNQKDAHRITYSDMPSVGHKIVPSSIRVREVIFNPNLYIEKNIRFLSAEEYEVEILTDDIGIERGFHLSLNNEKPASYYVDYKTEIILDEIKAGKVELTENKIPIFDNKGEMKWIDDQGKPQLARHNNPYTAKSLSATIIGDNKPGVTSKPSTTDTSTTASLVTTTYNTTVPTSTIPETNVTSTITASSTTKNVVKTTSSIGVTSSTITNHQSKVTLPTNTTFKPNSSISSAVVTTNTDLTVAINTYSQSTSEVTTVKETTNSSLPRTGENRNNIKLYLALIFIGGLILLKKKRHN